MARGRVARGSSKPLHPVKWVGMDCLSTSGSVSGVTTLNTIADSIELDSFTNPTIVRVRGWIETQLNQTTEGTFKSARVHFGIRVFDDQVITAGDLSVESVQEDPWMWLTGCRLTINLESSPVFNSSGTLQANFLHGVHTHAWRRFDVDVKAMRRVPQGSKLALQWTIESLTTGGSVDVAAQFRALVKE